MAWTAPMTAVANAVFTAAQFNAHVRDNLLETAPAKATTAGSIFVSSGTNEISERIPTTANVFGSCTRTSNTYAAPNTGTAGPEVTVTTGTQALVMLNADCFNTTASSTALMGFAISGASTVAASDSYAIGQVSSGTATGNKVGATFYVSGLTAGSNVFTCQYKASANTGTFQDRHITVIPL